jgi:hypothetical protein
MHINIFTPDQWHDFFVMVGGGAAALTGLVFVALSINLAAITQDATHRNRAIGTLTGFSAIFIICALGLIGNQNQYSLGIEWLAVSIPATFIYLRGYVLARTKGGSANGLSTTRTIFGTICYTAQILGSILLMCGYIWGLYMAAIAMVISFTSLISGAWLLIVGIQENQSK